MSVLFLILLMTLFYFGKKRRNKKYSFKELNYVTYRESVIDDRFRDVWKLVNRKSFNTSYFTTIGELLFKFNKSPNIVKIIHEFDEIINIMKIKKKSISFKEDIPLPNKNVMLRLYQVLQEEDTCDYKAYYKREIIYHSLLQVIFILWNLYISQSNSLNNYVVVCFIYAPSLVFSYFNILYIRDAKRYIDRFEEYKKKFYYNSVKNEKIQMNNDFDKFNELNDLLSNTYTTLHIKDMTSLLSMDSYQRIRIIDLLSTLIDLISMLYIKDSLSVDNNEIKEIISNINNEILQHSDFLKIVEQEEEKYASDFISNEIELKKNYLNILLKS